MDHYELFFSLLKCRRIQADVKWGGNPVPISTQLCSQEFRFDLPLFYFKSFITWHTCAFSLGNWLTPPSLKAIPAEEFLGQKYLASWWMPEGSMSNTGVGLTCGQVVDGLSGIKLATHLVLDPSTGFVGALLPLWFWKFVWFLLPSYRAGVWS